MQVEPMRRGSALTGTVSALTGRGSALAAAALLATTLVLPGTPAWAELAPWDQEVVTELADELVSAISELRRAERQRDQEPVGAARSSQVRYRQVLKGLEVSAKQLAFRLEDGQDREATLNVARKIRTLVADAREEGARIMNVQQTDVLIAPTQAALAALAPFYFE